MHLVKSIDTTQLKPFQRHLSLPRECGPVQLDALRAEFAYAIALGCAFDRGLVFTTVRRAG